jgi:hypothetical protein
MSTAALESWGWRIPFLLGLIVGIAGYLLRRDMLETVPLERRKRAPIVETLYDTRIAASNCPRRALAPGRPGRGFLPSRSSA